jgi:hypothetical protein
MTTRRSTTSARRPDSRNSARQKKQRVTAGSANLPRLEDRSKLFQMKRCTRDVFERKPERYLELKTNHSRAWWGHIANGRFDQVKPTIIDWYVIRAIAGVVGDESDLDTEILSKLLRVMECVGALVTSIMDLISVVRRKSKRTK